ncbi:unnamed protein product, partial [Prorocentrum cordatum]
VGRLERELEAARQRKRAAMLEEDFEAAAAAKRREVELVAALEALGAVGPSGSAEAAPLEPPSDGGGSRAGGPAAADPLTPSEAEAVQRIAELGFTHAAALEAFVAFGRDEELAANELLR